MCALQAAAIPSLILSKLFQLLTEINVTATSWGFVKANLLCFTFAMYSVDILF